MFFVAGLHQKCRPSKRHCRRFANQQQSLAVVTSRSHMSQSAAPCGGNGRRWRHRWSRERTGKASDRMARARRPKWSLPMAFEACHTRMVNSPQHNQPWYRQAAGLQVWQLSYSNVNCSYVVCLEPYDIRGILSFEQILHLSLSAAEKNVHHYNQM